MSATCITRASAAAGSSGRQRTALRVSEATPAAAPFVARADSISASSSSSSNASSMAHAQQDVFGYGNDRGGNRGTVLARGEARRQRRRARNCSFVPRVKCRGCREFTWPVSAAMALRSRALRALRVSLSACGSAAPSAALPLASARRLVLPRTGGALSRAYAASARASPASMTRVSARGSLSPAQCRRTPPSPCPRSRPPCRRRAAQPRLGRRASGQHFCHARPLSARPSPCARAGQHRQVAEEGGGEGGCW